MQEEYVSTPKDWDDFKEIEQADWRHRDSLSRAMCLTVTVLVVIFAIKDVIIGNHLLAFILCIFALANFSALLLYSHFRNLTPFSYYLIASCAALTLFLVAHGGTNNSGIIWMPAFPVLMFSMLRIRPAVIAVVLILSLALLLLYLPNHSLLLVNYEKYTKIAVIGTYCLISCFTYYQAVARAASSSAVARLNHELRHIASTDELTGLPNRRDMALALEFECKRAKRTQCEFSIILCDIDHFKKINDSFGHSTGDQALKTFSDLIGSSFREVDKVGRWGGEEFLVILPDTNLHDAILLAEKVRKRICQASLFPNMPNRLVTMSAGAASSLTSTDDIELLNLADKELFKAKNSGRNTVRPTTNTLKEPSIAIL